MGSGGVALGLVCVSWIAALEGRSGVGHLLGVVARVLESVGALTRVVRGSMCAA